MQITSAMKMVSPANFSRAQDAITPMRPYSEKLSELLQSLSASMADEHGSKYAEPREVKNVLFVAISSHRGLAGAFTANIINAVKYLARAHYSDKNVEVMTI